MGLIKTTALAVGGVALAGGLLLAWEPASSYLRTGARVAGQAAQDSIPTGFEIERIQTLVRDLDAVVAEQQARLVAQRVDLEYLQQEVRRAAERQQALEAEVAAARNVLSVERAVYRIGDRDYRRTEVVREARGKAEDLLRAREILDAKRETLVALESALGQAETQLAEARRHRDAYEMRLAGLRAKAENVAIRQELAVSLERLPEAIDAGSFQKVDEAFRRVERQLQVQDRLLNDRISAPREDAIAFAAPAEEDVLALLDSALEGEPAEQEVEPLPATQQAPKTVPAEAPKFVQAMRDEPTAALVR